MLPGQDPFVAGALWAAGVAFDELFGDVLGPLFFEQLVDVEVLEGTTWLPYQA